MRDLTHKAYKHAPSLATGRTIGARQFIDRVTVSSVRYVRLDATAPAHLESWKRNRTDPV